MTRKSRLFWIIGSRCLLPLIHLVRYTDHKAISPEEWLGWAHWYLHHALRWMALWHAMWDAWHVNTLIWTIWVCWHGYCHWGKHRWSWRWCRYIVWDMLVMWRPWYGPTGFAGAAIVIGGSIGGIGDGIDGACPFVDDELSIWVPVGWLVICWDWNLIWLISVWSWVGFKFNCLKSMSCHCN